MSDLLNDYYTTLKANELLEELFGDVPLVINIINSMTDTDRRLFAAFCDGKRATTTGYTIDADIYINRASAPVKAIRESCLPVNDEFVKTVSTLGKNTQVKRFFISREVISKLLTDPEKIITECREQLKESKLRKNKKDIKRIYALYGEKGTINLVKEAIKEEAQRQLNMSKK